MSETVTGIVEGIGFSIYTPEEVSKLSVKQITNANTFNVLLQPEKGGLYDPALGPCDEGSCPTCGLNSRECPGHMGHIELALPLYNPLFFEWTVRILRSM